MYIYILYIHNFIQRELQNELVNINQSVSFLYFWYDLSFSSFFSISQSFEVFPSKKIRKTATKRKQNIEFMQHHIRDPNIYRDHITQYVSLYIFSLYHSRYTICIYTIKTDCDYETNECMFFFSFFPFFFSLNFSFFFFLFGSGLYFFICKIFSWRKIREGKPQKAEQSAKNI